MTGYRGHPKYSKDMCEQVIEYFKEGMTIVEVSQKLGVTRQSYYDWKDKHPEFKRAAEFGEEAAEAFHCHIGRHAMLGFPDPDMKEEYMHFNTAIYCFTMKTRFKHRENDDPIRDSELLAKPLQINFKVAAAVDEIEITNSITQQEEAKKESEQFGI